MSQRPSIFPLRLQYVTPEGEEKWSETRATLHELRVLAWELREAGNRVEWAFRDAGSHGGNYSQYPMPWQAVRLGR